MSREDIESLGWVLHENSGIYSYEEFKLIYSPNYNNRLRIWKNQGNVGFSDTIFEGKILTKEEFTILLKQLEINE